MKEEQQKMKKDGKTLRKEKENGRRNEKESPRRDNSLGHQDPQKIGCLVWRAYSAVWA